MAVTRKNNRNHRAPPPPTCAGTTPAGSQACRLPLARFRQSPVLARNGDGTVAKIARKKPGRVRPSNLDFGAGNRIRTYDLRITNENNSSMKPSKYVVIVIFTRLCVSLVSEHGLHQPASVRTVAGAQRVRTARSSRVQGHWRDDGRRNKGPARFCTAPSWAQRWTTHCLEEKRIG